MPLEFDIDAVISHLKKNVLDEDSLLVSDVCDSLRHYWSHTPINAGFDEVISSFDFSAYIDKLTVELAEKLVGHGEQAVKRVLFKMIPNGMALVALVISFALC